MKILNDTQLLEKVRERFTALKSQSLEWFSFYNGFMEGYRLAQTKTRTNKQNAALHKFFKMLSDQLNELGVEYHYNGILGDSIATIFTEKIIKYLYWAPIQLDLFNTDSTTKLTTEQINIMLDIFTKHFGEKGIPVVFPCKANQLLNL